MDYIFIAVDVAKDTLVVYNGKNTYYSLAQIRSCLVCRSILETEGGGGKCLVSFPSLEGLAEAIGAFIAYYNETAKPIRWSYTVERVEHKLGSRLGMN